MIPLKSIIFDNYIIKNNANTFKKQGGISNVWLSPEKKVTV